MSRSSFWGGVAAGAAGTAAALWAGATIARSGAMQRVERSMQIARPAEEVFAACSHLEHMPQLIRPVVSVASHDDVSLWIADIAGQRFAWDVEIVQVIPKQVIGWKSHRGPKHSGRVIFFSLGKETLVHVEVNYVPGFALQRRLRRSSSWSFFTSSSWSMGDALQAALRDLKATLESFGRRTSEASSLTMHDAAEARATGTYGPLRERSTQDESRDELASPSEGPPIA